MRRSSSSRIWLTSSSDRSSSLAKTSGAIASPPRVESGDPRIAVVGFELGSFGELFSVALDHRAEQSFRHRQHVPSHT